jgi:hypothetical protein
MYVGMYVCKYVCMHMCVCVRVCACMHICIMYVCMCDSKLEAYCNSVVFLRTYT